MAENTHDMKEMYWESHFCSIIQLSRWNWSHCVVCSQGSGDFLFILETSYLSWRSLMLSIHIWHQWLQYNSLRVRQSTVRSIAETRQFLESVQASKTDLVSFPLWVCLCYGQLSPFLSQKSRSVLLLYSCLGQNHIPCQMSDLVSGNCEPQSASAP